MLDLDMETPSEAEEERDPRHLPQMAPTLSPEALRRIDRQLRKQRKELRAGIERIEATVARPGSARPEGPTIDILRGELEQTDEALERLARGTYGTCQVCGAPIPLPRLQIIPSASRCGTCGGSAPAGGAMVH